MKTDWEYEQAVREKLRQRQRHRRRSRLTAGVFGGVLALALTVGTAALTMRGLSELPQESGVGAPESTERTGASRVELSLDEIEEQAVKRLVDWLFAFDAQHLTSNATHGMAYAELEEAIRVYGTAGEYWVCQYADKKSAEELYTTFGGYTFRCITIDSPSPLGMYAIGEDDVYPLETAIRAGLVKPAEVYALLPKGMQAGTPDSREPLPDDYRAGLAQLCEQTGCVLPEEVSVRWFDQGVFFWDNGMQEQAAEYWTYGQQYGRALRCLVKDQPSKVGLYYYSSTTNELITIETALQEQKIFLPELYEILPEEMFVPVSYNPDRALTEEQSAALSTMVQYLAEQGASEEIPPPGSAVSTGIKAYDSINGCVVVKVDTVKNGVAAEVAIDGVVFRSEDTHAPYALGLYLVRGQEVLTLEEALDAGWATAKEVQFALPSAAGGTTPTVGPEGTPPPPAGSSTTTAGPSETQILVDSAVP